MREHINLNDNWRYSNTFCQEMTEEGYDERNMEEVRLPHTNVMTPYHYFDEQIYQFVSCYRRHISAKNEWRGKQVLLTFEGVGHVAKVYLNGKLITSHYGGYTAFTVDLGPHLKFGEEVNSKDNILAVEVDSQENCNLPPFGNVIDYLTYGGIYREVSLEIKEQISIEDIFVVGEAAQEGSAKAKLQVKLHGLTKGRSKLISVRIADMDENVLYQDMLTANYALINTTFNVTGVKNWDIDNPNLYYLHLELLEGDASKNVPIDSKTIRFGFRTCEFCEDGFYLNQKKLKLLGLNRHQSFPYVGYAMPKRLQRQDAEILKSELGVNAVRTSHYPQSRHFIDRCDELGLLVFTELPGWHYIGDENWKAVACQNVREMVMQYRNHPSIILWGVRINESEDDDAFYQETNQIAHELDPTRQTGGVRCLKKGNLLEDVYTYNDFLYNGKTKGLERKKDVTSNLKAPYLVSEFNGHMYPTKPFDDEDHRLEHALRHARVLDELFGQDEIVGGFGWCMFDYNTHKDFGSGDRICYHGVMDMFRNPKAAAAVYASQSDISDFCYVCSSMDIGEHPEGNIGDIYVFTNADSIKLYKNDEFIREFYPNRKSFPHLPHPPVIIDDFIGGSLEKNERFDHKTAEALKEALLATKKYGLNNLPMKYKLKMGYLILKEHLSLKDGTDLYYKYIGNWGSTITTYRFEAIKGGETVKVIEKKPVSQPRLIMTATTTTLHEEETYDAAEVRIMAVDESGNHLPYYQEPLQLKTRGAVELIGPEMISLKGGTAGTFIKTKGITGTGGLKIYQETLGEVELIFMVE